MNLDIGNAHGDRKQKAREGNAAMRGEGTKSPRGKIDSVDCPSVRISFVMNTSRCVCHSYGVCKAKAGIDESKCHPPTK